MTLDAEMAVILAFLLLLAVSFSHEVAPKISYPPQDATGVDGQDVLFSCTVDGNPPPSVIWTKEGEELKPAANSRFNFSSAGNNHSLILTDIQRSDAGQYRCLASNSDGNLTSAPATLTVHFAPAILNQLPPGITRLTREGNEYIVFSCTVEGNPSPLLYWTKNGKRLNVIGNPRLSAVSWRGIHSLNIVNLSRSDAGLYQCVAVNSVGSVASHGENLRVYFAPEMSCLPKHATRVEGQDVIFSCTMDGDPPPSVIWTKNGEELKVAGNSRVNVSSTSNNHSLILADIQRSHAGQYRCLAINSDGNLTSAPATLTVHFAPAILNQLPPGITRLTREGNEYIVFSCTVEGNPSPLLYWTKNGKRLNVIGNPRLSAVSWRGIHSLNIVNLSRSDAGLYQCVAVNSVGSVASHGENLRVYFAPEISCLPKHATRVEGQDVIFSCTIDGDPPPGVIWTKNGEEPKVAGNSRVNVSSTSNNHSLILTDIQRSDAGQYRCLASNSEGNLTSSPATLTVHFAPEIFYLPKNATTVEGQDVIFSCTIDGDPPPSVIWTKNGEELKLAGNSRVNVSSTSSNYSLIFTGIQRSDAGEYRCLASNSEGNLTSSPATLTVHFAPEISYLPKNATTVEGQDVIFSCTIDGDPPPSVIWTKNGEELKLAGNSRVNVSSTSSNYSLIFTGIQRSDAGEYRCLASNSEGNLTSSPATLTVHFEPEISYFPKNATTVEGQDVIFSCTIDGDPPPSVIWTKNGEELKLAGNSRVNVSSTSSNHSLIFTGIQRSDAGEYRCLASNSEGNLTSSPVTLTVHSPPEFTINPRNAIAIKGENVTLRCKVYGNPVPDVKWTKDEKYISGNERMIVSDFGANTSSLTITDIVPGDTGQYRCMANNSVADATSSPGNILVKYKPAVEIVGLGKLSLAIGSQMQLTCRYNASPPVYEVQWVKDGPVIARNATIIGNERANISKFTVSESILTVISSVTQDGGDYKCLVANVLGNSSATTSVIISQEPTAAPQNVRGKSISSTSILVTWEEVPPADRNGVILTHTVTYKSLTEGNNGSETVNSNKFHKELTNLKKFVNYSITVFSTNQIGDGPASNPIFVTTSQAIKDDRTSRRSFHIILGFACGFAFIFAVSIFIVFKRFRRKKKNTIIEVLDDEEDDVSMQEMRPEIMNELRDRNQQACAGQPALPGSNEDEAVVVDNEMYLVQMAFERNWEIPRERLEITETELGGGEFGVVRKGTYLRRDGNELPVAVKMLRDENDQNQRMALIQELEMLRKVGRHTNIVSLIGACSFEEPLCVVVEFVPGGSLDDVLLDSRIPAQTHDANYVNICSKLSERDLLKIAKDVANGMRHLESKLCVHRDLAARNILIGEGLVAKVADFGLSRDISQDGEYIKFTEGKVPWLWMSMESLRGINTTMSDVWSFGVVLWEIVTLGERPYTGIIGIVELFTMLQDGMRLEKPPHCSKELYDIMLQCWQETPEDRPTFKDLHSKLHSILSESAVTYINIAFFEEQRNETGEKDIPDNGV
ncbi:fibroblast growth factor receptor 4-like isoform X2 [Montipora capricornis]|uniref:fibroblast growth factor receptor 4-like isoform X2 n=1 Tax=Montipora capricornis TaxID=246305 RepID=UPI0035F1AD25